MPLKFGKDKKIVSENIKELKGGKTYERTKEKYGKGKADKQSVAIALEKAGKSRSKKKNY